MFHNAGLVIVAQVSIPFDHVVGLVPKDGSDLGEGCAVHGEIAGSSVAEVMETKV